METLELPKNQTLKQKQNNILKKRINYFDIAKGLGILLMIIGHMPIKNEYLKNYGSRYCNCNHSFNCYICVSSI